MEEGADILKYEKRNIRKMSLKFVQDINKDAAKRILIIPKIILESLCLWPGKDNWAMKAANYVVFANLLVIEIVHLFYLYSIVTVSDVTSVAHVCTTVFTLLQTACKLICLRYNKPAFNGILSELWDNFWPLKVASRSTQRAIKRNMRFVKTTCLFYLCLAQFSVAQFMVSPLVWGNEMLPLASKFPFFDHKRVVVFELLYVWQYFIATFFIATTLSGFDFFLCALVMNVVAQFQILQDVLRNVYASESEEKRREIYESLGVSAGKNGHTIVSEMFKKCVDHHIRLLSLCANLEKCASFIIFMQFFVSSMALCVSSLVLTTNPSEIGNMFTYAIAHLIQLFILCSIGSELTYQSLRMAEAAVECGYQADFNKDVRHGLLMIVQRSQREVKLTALGFTDLNYPNFVMLLRLSFSYYTMLDSFH